MDLNERLAQIKADIKLASDDELEMMGAETHMLYQVVAGMYGREASQAKACAELLEILRGEWRSRHNKTDEKQAEAQPVVQEKCPATFYELMAKGDGSVAEPEMKKR
jgi:hypothetical protein